MAIVFLSRPVGYKAGVVSLYVATLLFLVGNFNPYWLRFSVMERNISTKDKLIYYKSDSGHTSALSGCSEGFENGTYTNGDGSLSSSQQGGWSMFTSQWSGCGLGFFADPVSGGWVKACQVFEWLGILALLLACAYTVVVNFKPGRVLPIRRFPEIATVTAGVLGFLGAVIFAGKLGGTVRDSPNYVFGWSVFFTIVLSILIVIDGVVIAIFNSISSYEAMD